LPVVTGAFLVGMITKDALTSAGLTDDEPEPEDTCVACSTSEHVRRDPRAGCLPLCTDCLGRTRTELGWSPQADWTCASRPTPRSRRDASTKTPAPCHIVAASDAWNPLFMIKDILVCLEGWRAAASARSISGSSSAREHGARLVGLAIHRRAAEARAGSAASLVETRGKKATETLAQFPKARCQQAVVPTRSLELRGRPAAMISRR